MRLTRFVLPSLAVVATVALVGCSSGAASDSDAADERTTVSVRIWDESIADAYRESFDAFEEQNEDVAVDLNVVPWDEYWTTLRTDVASGTADDIFWLNAANFPEYSDSNSILNIDEALGANARNAWQTPVVDQFTRDDALWGVPQLLDAGAVIYYNADLLQAADVDPADLEGLVWSTDEEQDTFVELAKKLTRDEDDRSAADEDFAADKIRQFGTNLANDFQAIVLPYIGSSGGSFAEGDDFAFAGAEATAAFTYLVDAINTHRIAPPAERTNTDSNFSRDAFVAGDLALFQSGPYTLKHIAENADFSWGIAPIPEGPDGAISVATGVAAAGNAQSDNPDAQERVLTWMGSEEGNAHLGENGSAIPAVNSAESSYAEYWDAEGVDVQPFFDTIASGATVGSPSMAKFAAGREIFQPILNEMFRGDREVADALTQAQDLANVAIHDEDRTVDAE